MTDSREVYKLTLMKRMFKVYWPQGVEAGKVARHKEKLWQKVNGWLEEIQDAGRALRGGGGGGGGVGG